MSQPRAVSVVALLLFFGACGVWRLQAQQALVVTQSGREAVDEATLELVTALESREFVTEVREPLPGDDPGDLSAFDCVWDLRTDFSLTALETTRYTELAGLGGGFFFIGEHGSFAFRNDSVTNWLQSVGGGDAIVSSDPPLIFTARDIPENIDPSHPLAFDCEPVTQVVYDGIDNGTFLSAGTGLALTADGSEVGAAVWDEGRLIDAPLARAVVVLDINFLSTGDTGTLDTLIDGTTPTENRAFLENLITFTCAADCCIASPADPTDPRSAMSGMPPMSPMPPLVPRSPCPPVSSVPPMSMDMFTGG